MSPEHDKQLCEKYPKIFADRHGDVRSTAMCWGFECGDGWYWLLDRLCHHIQFLVDNDSPETGRMLQVVASQVKEKFGGLRFYYYGGDAKVDAVVHFAEHLSCHICEECGTTQNVVHTAGWIASVCRTCAATLSPYNTRKIVEDIRDADTSAHQG